MSKKRGREEEADDAIKEPGAIKAEVTESNGEISCTVEETNRLRALLGLRPLDVDKSSKDKQAVDNFRSKREEEAKAREAREISERLEKARDRRMLEAKVSGPGLGEIAGNEEELLSAADWVKRSRKVEISEKSRQFAKKIENDEKEMLQQQQQLSNGGSKKSYTSSDLEGLSIMHSAQDLGLGQDIILTLADSGVLEKDERGRAKGLRESDDVLENVNLAEASRKAERDKVMKKAKQSYTGYDDDEFEPGSAVGARRSVLPQYDKIEKQGPQLKIGAGGGIEVGGSSGRDSIMSSSAMDVADEQLLPQSLRVDIRNASEYYTKAEYSSFQKPKKIKSKGKDKDKGEKKQQKKMRTKDADEGLDLETMLRQSGAVGAEGEDRRLREGGTASSIDNTTQQHRAAYDAAVAKAEQKTLTSVALARVPPPAAAAAVEDDDADIAQSLARARRLALHQRQGQNQHQDQAQGAKAAVLDSGAQWCKQRVAQQSQAEAAAANESKSTDDELKQLSVDGRKADGTLVFSDTTEFSARMQAQLGEAARNRAEAVVKATERQQSSSEGGNNRAPAAAAGATGLSGSRMSVEGDEDEEIDARDVEEGEAEDEAEGDSEGLDQGASFLSSEPVVATGMAATLALLKNTGELTGAEKLVGRSKDARAIDPSSREFDVKIDYRDETGRKLTQKEAFRQINYQFHGIAPGKKKQEKRLKQLQLEERLGSSRAVTGEGGTMRSLVQAQQATGSAYITVQAGGGVSDLISSSSGGASITAAEVAAQLFAKQQQAKQKQEKVTEKGKGPAKAKK